MTFEPLLAYLGYSVLATLAIMAAIFIVVVGIFLWEGRP